MRLDPPKPNRSHGSGRFEKSDFAKIGRGVVLEPGVLVFHPENIEIGDNVYVGHNTILKGYYENRMTIGDHTWIGQGCFLHSAGGLEIGTAVGVGPCVKILTSQHSGDDLDAPVLYSPLEFGKVILGDGCDLGVGSIVLPGVTIGEGAVVGAGAVVTRDIPAFEVWAGVPAAFLRKRGG